MTSKLRIPRILWALFIIITIVSPAFAQDDAPESDGSPREEEEFIPTYGLGDQLLSLNLGMLFPLFYTGGPDGIEDANLTLGGTGHLMWSSFLTNDFAVGGEFGGMFAFTPNRNTLFMIPLAARASYFLRAYPFEFPLTLAAGINFSRFRDNFKVDPIVIPGAGFYWNYNTEWAFGVDVRYWWVPQVYSGPEPPEEDTRFGNFLGTTLSVLYRF
ncbi:MAG: TP0733 family outer membrane beta-barrel protein [Alkalispirochaeta sp.]